MDMLTHAFAGLSLAEVVIDFKPRLGKDWWNYRYLCMLIAVVPNLDRLPGLLFPKLRVYWRNRLLHNVFAAVLVTALFTAFALEVLDFYPEKIHWVWPSFLGSYLLHLLFDYLTNRSIAPFYPLSSKEFGRRLLWHLDPYLLTIFAIAAWLRMPRVGFPAMLIYLLIVRVAKRKALRRIGRSLGDYKFTQFWIEPYPYRCWRWFQICLTENGDYFMRRVSLDGDGSWQMTPSGRGTEAEQLALQHPFFRAHAKRALVPRYELRRLQDKQVVIVDDVANWHSSKRRNDCFLAYLTPDGSIERIRCTSWRALGPFGEPERLPLKLRTPPRL